MVHKQASMSSRVSLGLAATVGTYSARAVRSGNPVLISS